MLHCGRMLTSSVSAKCVQHFSVAEKWIFVTWFIFRVNKFSFVCTIFEIRQLFPFFHATNFRFSATNFYSTNEDPVCGVIILIPANGKDASFVQNREGRARFRSSFVPKTKLSFFSRILGGRGFDWLLRLFCH